MWGGRGGTPPSPPSSLLALLVPLGRCWTTAELRLPLPTSGWNPILVRRQAFDQPFHATPGGPHSHPGQPSGHHTVATPLRVEPERIPPNPFRYAPLTPLFHHFNPWGGRFHQLMVLKAGLGLY